MTKSPVTLPEPVIGKVISSTHKSNNVTSFIMEEGSYQDHIFVRAGEKQKGEDALRDILKNQLADYLRFVTLTFHLTLSGFCLTFATV
jgi:hypothetical protein